MTTAAAKPLPSSPQGHLLLGHLPELRADPLGFVTRCAREHGDFVPLRLGTVRAVLISHPAAIEEVLVTQDHSFVKPVQMRIMRRLLGNALIAADGEVWKRQRKLVDPAFDHAQMSGYAELALSQAEELAASWQDGEQRHIYRDMLDLATRVACKALFDTELSRDALEVIDTASTAALDQVQQTMTSVEALIPQAVPTPGNRRLRQAVRRLDGVVHGMIRERRVNGGVGRDLLSALVQARDHSGALSGERELRDIVTVLLLTGREPAVTLTWAWYLLARHPQELARLEAAFEAELGDRAPVVADLPRLKAAEKIVLETLRLYPPGWIIGRQAVQDCEVAGYRVPKGMHVLMSPWVMHRDPRYFGEPDAFQPERWTDELTERLPRCVYFPHSVGPRVCPGEAFTRQEMVLVLVAIAQKFRLSLAPGQGEVQPSAVLLRPKGEIKMAVRRRQ